MYLTVISNNQCPEDQREDAIDIAWRRRDRMRAVEALAQRIERRVPMSP